MPPEEGHIADPCAHPPQIGGCRGCLSPVGCGRSPHLIQMASSTLSSSSGPSPEGAPAGGTRGSAGSESGEAADGTPLVLMRDLSRTFRQSGGAFSKDAAIYAVRGVNLAIYAGRTLGVVGESGCGKSTLGRMAVGLLSPTEGNVFFGGVPLYDEAGRAHFQSRDGAAKGLAGRVQMIFQDPYSSLNPRMQVGTAVGEPLVCSGKGGTRDAIRRKVADMLERVGLGEESARRYPHEFSGGQRQRIAIARALITRPAFVVCDEPTSSLDASVQAQVLNLLRDMQESLGLSYLFISHDLSVVRHMSDRVAVMYRGLIVEEAGADDLFRTPAHPYTRLLVDSVPGLRGPSGEALAGEEEEGGRSAAGASGLSADSGCPFAPRCPQVMELCLRSLPPFFPRPQGRPETGGDAHAGDRVRCFLFQR